MFCGENTKHRVVWGDAKMCPRWHSKQYCFKDCVNEASHVPDNEVPADKKAEYKEYLVKVRK